MCSSLGKILNYGNSTSETKLPNIFTVRKVYYEDEVPRINSY